MSPRNAALPLLVGALAWGCIPDNHPLPPGGSALFLLDQKPLYAADMLDDNGLPVLPRQLPYEKDVQLFLTSANAPDHGAYVDVLISPPKALDLLATDDTCEQLPGAFRCTGAEDGYANFRVRSESDWSGTPQLSLTGRSTNETASITVNPAGLPATASNFELIIEGIEGSKVPAAFTSLSCVLEAGQEETPFDKWPKGEIRARRAEVRATAPFDTPAIIKNAPVIIESLHAEAFVTLDSRCRLPHDSRLRLQLDAKGLSPEFFFCFSDLGGSVSLSATSWQKSTRIDLLVALEPRLLRVVTTDVTIEMGQYQVEVGTVSAFLSTIEQASFTVDVRSSDPTVLQIDTPYLTLPLSGQEPIRVTPLKPGEATIEVTPQLFSTPQCDSDPITVIEP